MTDGRWMTVRQAATCLNLSPQTVRKYIHAGELTAYRAGSVEIRVFVDDIDEFLRARPVNGPAAVRQPKERASRARRAG